MFTEYIKYYKKYREEYDKVAVLMQVGAFYEILGLNDVGNVYDIAGVLNINVTRSNKNIQEVSEVNPLMAGFPLVSLNKYLCCLVEHGYTVIVVDQTMLKGSKKQTRKVSGVYSSGVLPPDILDQSETVVMSVVCHGDEVSILCMYVSTNSLLLYTETVGTVGQLLDTLMEYIRVHGVSEVVVHNVEAKYETMLLDAIDIPVHVKGLETLYENVGYQETFLRKVYTHVDFGLLTPAEYFDLTHYPLALTNLVAAFTFIEAHNGKYLCNIAVPKMTIATDYLLLENNALEQLAIFGKGMRKNDSVMSVIDHTLTAIGKRSLRLLLSRPYKRYEDISRRLELCDIFDKAKGVIDDIRGELKGITDFTRVYRKVHLQVAGVSDIQQLHSCFKRVVEITCYLMCNIPQLERLGWIPCEQSFRDLLDYINTHVDLDSPWVFKRVEEINTLAGKLRDQYTIIDHEITKLDRYLEKANCIKLQETEGEIVLVCSKIRTELIKRGLVNDKRIAEYTIKANTS
ncbi:hypothetical protein EB077_09895, partial [bacterium]|nr:hypothetical protein [bacterium]